MKRKTTTALLTVLILLLFAPSVGCERFATGSITAIPPETVPLLLLSETPQIPVKAAAGNNVIMNRIAEIDASNTKDGYVLVRNIKKTYKPVKIIVKRHGGTPYIYTLRPDSEYEVFPFSEGNGDYQITVYENVIDNKYYPVFGTTQNVRLTDEFTPFIRPNQYVNYNPDSMASKKAAELTKDAKSTPDKIAAIYNYIIKNITYDHQLADSVQSGYIPDVDNVLKSGKGICFDYAALITAMLRSQGIPAKLVVGYRGKAYHAWISAYSDEKGRVSGDICFDKSGWKLMDPIFTNGVDDEKIYFTKFIY